MNFEDKTELFKTVLKEFEREFQTLFQSALEAKQYATDEDSRAENKYDTRGLEASYLAQGQATRAEAVKHAIGIITQMEIRHFDRNSKIEATALIELLADDQQKYLLMIPSRGGHKIKHKGKTVQTVSPESPIGRSLYGKKQGECFEFQTRNTTVEYEIVKVI